MKKMGGGRHVLTAKVKVKLREIPMNKSDADDAGDEVIAFIKQDCDRITKWAHDVLACTERRRAEAVDVRAEANKYIKETVFHHQALIDCIHYIIDMVPDDRETRFSDQDILDAMRAASKGRVNQTRALATVKLALSENEPDKLFDFKLEHWLRHQNCGRKSANFIMQTLTDLRGAA